MSYVAYDSSDIFHEGVGGGGDHIKSSALGIVHRFIIAGTHTMPNFHGEPSRAYLRQAHAYQLQDLSTARMIVTSLLLIDELLTKAYLTSAASCTDTNHFLYRHMDGKS
jgi:hypothetical protein